MRFKSLARFLGAVAAASMGAGVLASGAASAQALRIVGHNREDGCPGSRHHHYRPGLQAWGYRDVPHLDVSLR